MSAALSATSWLEPVGLGPSWRRLADGVQRLRESGEVPGEENGG